MIEGNFKVIENLEIPLNEGEICIKNLSESDECLYARKYKYVAFGKIIIEDRLLDLKLRTELINKKKKLILY